MNNKENPEDLKKLIEILDLPKIPDEILGKRNDAKRMNIVNQRKTILNAHKVGVFIRNKGDLPRPLFMYNDIYYS